MDAPDAVADPPDVVEHTRRLMEREDVMKQFVTAAVEETGVPEDVVRQTDLWTEYKVRSTFDPDSNLPSVTKKAFYEEMARLLGEPVRKSGGVRMFWRGMCIKLRAPDDEGDFEAGGDDPLGG